MSTALPTSVLHGLYVIADSSQSGPNVRLSEKVAQAIQGGARLVQVRDKRTEPDVDEIRIIAALCQQHHIPLLINDSIDLAIQVGADGVHLGQSDTGLAEARQHLGDATIIGITCHNNIELARHAEAEGANYVAFGRFFTSKTKPEAPPADIAILRHAKRELHIPVVAIGGITPDNGGSLIQAGADMLAVVHSVFGQNDISAAAKKFSQLFEQQD